MRDPVITKKPHDRVTRKFLVHVLALSNGAVTVTLFYCTPHAYFAILSSWIDSPFRFCSVE